MKISIFKKQAPEAVEEQKDAGKIEKTYQINKNIMEHTFPVGNLGDSMKTRKVTEYLIQLDKSYNTD